ncbi:hypothetical protein [Streptomyces sp. NPDC059883]|uniref:hypothetical protein n=1 Tax=unclassified Streptomyces TaxID=2593676 RepID=UPI0036659650
MIKMLHEKGLRSEHMYTAGVVSIGLAIASWMGSMRYEPTGGLDRADRWGIFVGEWAPTFFCMGLALSQYEQTEEEKQILREEVPRDLSSL